MQVLITDLINKDGLLKTRATLSRVGIQKYLMGGEWVRILRTEDAVKASAPTFEGLPVTLNHPESFLDGATEDENIKGHGKSIKYRDGVVKGELTITDKDAVKQALDTHRYISLGYRATLVKDAGVWTDVYGVHGTINESYPYDYRQENIKGDHIALVEQPRAGAIASLQIDEIETAQTEEEMCFTDSIDEIPQTINVTNNKKVMPKSFIWNDSILTLDSDNADDILKVLNSQKENIKSLNDSLSTTTTQLSDATASLSAKTDEVSNLAGQLEALKVQLADAQTAKTEIETKLADAQSSTLNDSEISERIATWNQVLPVMQRDKADYKPNYSYSVSQIRAEYLKSKAPHLEQQLKDGNDAFIAGLWEGLKPGEETATTSEDLRMTLDAADVTLKPTKQISRNRPITNK